MAVNFDPSVNGFVVTRKMGKHLPAEEVTFLESAYGKEGAQQKAVDYDEGLKRQIVRLYDRRKSPTSKTTPARVSVLLGFKVGIRHNYTTGHAGWAFFCNARTVSMKGGYRDASQRALKKYVSIYDFDEDMIPIFEAMLPGYDVLLKELKNPKWENKFTAEQKMNLLENLDVAFGRRHNTHKRQRVVVLPGVKLGLLINKDAKKNPYQWAIHATKCGCRRRLVPNPVNAIRGFLAQAKLLDVYKWEDVAKAIPPREVLVHTLLGTFCKQHQMSGKVVNKLIDDLDALYGNLPK